MKGIASIKKRTMIREDGSITHLPSVKDETEPRPIPGYLGKEIDLLTGVSIKDLKQKELESLVRALAFRAGALDKNDEVRPYEEWNG